MQIKIHPHLFNPVYWHIIDVLSRPEIRHVYIMGGSSAAKTYSIDQALMIEGQNMGFSSIVFRKEQASINDTIYNDFKEINELFKLSCNMQSFLIKMQNNVIRFRGLDKSDKAKGLKGYKKILLDELDHFTYDDLKEFRRRLRGEELQQLFYTWNPVSKEHWVKKKLVDLETWIEAPKHIENCPSKYSTLSNESRKWINEKGDSILIKTNHKDNYWVVGHPDERFGRIDKHALNEFEWMAKYDPEDHKIYALGEWGNPKVDDSWIKTFEDHKHISDKAVFVSGKQFIVSFDFNIGNTCAVFSHVGSEYIHFFDEMVSHDLPSLCTSIKLKYGKYLSSCIITGDKSGQNRTHLISDNMNSYRIIKNKLNITQSQIKIIVNPPHKENRFTCNVILASHPNVLFHSSLTGTIFDIKFVESNQDGGIIKKDRGVANQKADLLDCFRYTLNTFKKKWVKNYNPK